MSVGGNASDRAGESAPDEAIEALYTMAVGKHYRYFSGNYHFFDSVAEWYGNAQSGNYHFFDSVAEWYGDLILIP